MSGVKPTDRDDFTVAIICALPLEYDAVSYAFDEFWDEDGDQYGRADGDPNSYTTGRIGQYNVVLALLPSMGKANAASAAASMRSSYTHVKLALLVGVCGGSPHDGESKIFLGDVVISQSVIQYDFGRQYSDKFVPKQAAQDTIGRGNKDLETLMAALRTDRGQTKLRLRMVDALQQVQNQVAGTKREGKYDCPGPDKDQLFLPEHRHKHYSATTCVCQTCEGPSDPVCDDALSLSCAELGCLGVDASNVERIRSRVQAICSNAPPQPEVHIGVVASGDLVLKSGVDRERIHKANKAIAFEMEGAGVWNEVPCIVIKAVCDYADSHKQKNWQNYAAATAASASKAILEAYIRTDDPSVKKKPDQAKAFSMVPFPQDPDFVERPEIAEWLRVTLKEPSRRAALVGLGGVGKSQIAIQYAYNAQREDSSLSVLWVHASTTQRFREAYQDIADRLKLPGREDPAQVLLIVRRWLANEDNGPWLMIVDNADTEDVLFSNQPEVGSGEKRPVASCVPKTGNGAVLVTSRNLEVAERLVGDDATYRVPVMDHDQAAQLLRNRLDGTSYKEDDAVRLVETLDYLPLAIIQATSYIKRRGARGGNIASYLKEFPEKKAQLLAKEAKDLRRDESASHAVTTTWQITFDQMQRERRSATELLIIMSFFNPHDIPEFILQAYSKQHDADNFDEDIEILLGYSLVTATAQDQTFEMHMLVQFCTQEWLSTFDDREKWRCRFLGVMAAEYPEDRDVDWVLCQKLDPHIEAAVEFCPNELSDVRNWSTLMEKVANYRLGNRRLGEAEAMGRRLVEAGSTTFGAEDPRTLRNLSFLADLLLLQGQTSEALDIEKQALEAKMRVLGLESEETLRSMLNLASVFAGEGRWSEAEGMHRQNLRLLEQALGPDHVMTLCSVLFLADFLSEGGKYQEAEEMHRQNLKSMMQVLGTASSWTLASMDGLARLLYWQERYEEAEGMYRQIFKARTETFGAYHPSTLKTSHALAVVLGRMGKNGEAEEMNRSNLEARTRLFGAEHPDTLDISDNLAHALLRSGQNSEGEEIMRRNLEVRTRVFGAEDAETLWGFHKLALMLWKQGKHHEAEKMQWQNLETMRRVLGTQNPDTISCAHTLALMLWSTDQRSEAMTLLGDCISEQESAWGPEDPQTQLFKMIMGDWMSEK